MLINENPVFEAADVHNYAESERSFLDDASDFVTKGVPLAIGSGITSMANTAISLGNALGGDNEKIDYAQNIRDYDDDLSKYYTQHQEGIDLGGFVATSFIPGMAGVKALRVIQAGGLGKSAASVTGLFRNAEDAYLKKALSGIQVETNQVFKFMDGNKIASIAAGFGEQALQAGAFETATLLSMNQNPTINKEDQGYFASMLYNSPEILKGALLGGFVGGTVNALGISGKLKTAIRARDKDDFPSLHINEQGLSDIDQGTLAALDFYWLRGRQKTFEASKESGALNERQISNFEKSQEQKANELLTRFRTELAERLPNGKEDASLAKSLWNHLQSSADLGGDLPEEVGLRLLGAATNFSRVSAEDSSAAATKVYMGESALSERHAKNILKRGKVAPGEFDVTPDAASLEEMKMAGYEMFKDSGGNYRVIPGIKYESQLNRNIDAKKHDFIIKMGRDQAGRISETAYPVLGDLGDVSFNNGKLLVNGAEYPVKSYNPLENEPLESSTGFLRERLTPKLSPDLGTLEISSDNLPRLDKAFIEGYDNVKVVGRDGEIVTEKLDKDTLGMLKLERRQELINAGHDFGRIARELNVSQEFAETGHGEFVLGKIEDHTIPNHVRIDYNTSLLPDKNYLRGVSDLITRVKLAKEHNAKVAALILGDAYNELPKTEGTMLGINTLPELGNFVKSADEMYGNFGQLMQSVGKIADREIRKRVEETLGRISSAHYQIESDPELLKSFNLLVAKVRSAKEPLAWLDEETLAPARVVRAMAKEGADQEGILSAAAKDIFKVDEPAFQNYLRTTQDINGNRVGQINAYFAAKGSATQWDPSIVYLPPINTRKYPFVAFVREKAESELRPVSVVSAPDAAALEAKIRSIKQDFGDTLDVYTKTDVENFHKMQGDYESGLLLGNSTVDNALAKKGVLSDFAPRTDNEILKDFNGWHTQQEQMLVRNAIELQYAQEFAELRAMGTSFMEYQKSRFGRDFTTKEYAELRKDNPYEKYISTALAVSNYSKYDSVWGRMNSGVEGFGQTMFKVWDSVFGKAKTGEISWEAANAEASSYGFRPPFGDMLKEVINPLVTDKKIVEPLIAKVNGVLATTILRLDPLNSIVNILGTPALIAAELRNIAKNLGDPDKVGKLTQLLEVAIPGGNNKMPSSVKLIHDALSNFISDDGKLLDYYTKIGAVRSDLKLYKDVLDASQLSQEALKNDKSMLEWGGNLLSKAANAGATITGNNLSERMVRFVAADIMRQLGETAGLSQGELSAYINTFVNRVHGNYTASQRPTLFQGAVGQAISLFQTYQFNVMQNMVRFVEQNDKVAIGALLGMQNTLFGLQGNPAFYLLNSAIGNANREHKDLVTGAYSVVGKETADWMMYGLGSNALHTNLYNRGDLTPRYVTVVPTTLQDIPAVSIPAKFLNNFVDTLGAISKGGSLKQSLLEGLAMNGVNRPMAGLAQLAQGYRTTNKGNLLVAYNDLDTWTVAAKLLGGEEMNRALAIDDYYRQVAYKKLDANKIADVGEALKNKIRSGEKLNPEDVTSFMSQYSRSGGRVDSFNRFMVENMKNANKSQIEKMQEATRSPFSRNLSTIMGAEDESFLYKTNSANSAELDPAVQ